MPEKIFDKLVIGKREAAIAGIAVVGKAILRRRGHLRSKYRNRDSFDSLCSLRISAGGSRFAHAS